MLKTVLVPVDGSEDSIRAVDHCIEIAKSTKIEKIVVFHASAIPARLQSISGKLGSLFIQMKNDLIEYGEEKLAEAKKRIEESNIESVLVETKLIFGDASHSIIDEANNQKCDLIVIGSRGLSGIQSRLMGSVSNYVVQNAKCTVYVVKEKRY